MKKLTILVVALIAVSQVHASGISLGYPSYGGNGCPAGSASISLSPDSQTLSILFDEFIAEAGPNGRSLDRKSCNIAIPVHVPQGLSVSIFQTDYRGYVNVPVGGDARLNVEYFFAGQRGPIFSKVFNGNYSSNYLFRNDVVGVSQVWSACGEDVILRTNSNMTVKTNRQYHDAIATVDSVDVNSGLIYHLRWRSCN